MKKEDRLVLNTKKSLYAPMEVVIDGKVYQSLKITHAVLAEIDKLDEEIPGPNADEALYKIPQLIFNIDAKILEELDKREVEDIYIFIKRKFAEIEKVRLKLIADVFELSLDSIGRFDKSPVKKVIPKDRKTPGSKQ